MEQGKRKLSETVLVHCTDVRVLLEILCGETKLEFGIVRCGKGFPKCTFIPLVNFNHTFHYLSHRLIWRWQKDLSAVCLPVCRIKP